jgi:hypothetical protein
MFGFVDAGLVVARVVLRLLSRLDSSREGDEPPSRYSPKRHHFVPEVAWSSATASSRTASAPAARASSTW